MVTLHTKHDPYSLLVVRIVFGIIFIAHGLPKLRNIEATSQGFQAMGFAPGAFWARFIALLEVLGGGAMIVGVMVQPLAWLFAIEMLVTALKVNRKKGLVGGYEFDLILLAVAVLLGTLGAGKISLDQYLPVFLF